MCLRHIFYFYMQSWYVNYMLRKLVLTFILADNYLSNLVRKPFKTQWTLEGKCKKCGKCCRDIGLTISPKLLKSRFTTEIVIRWVSWVFDFYLKHIQYDSCLLVFGCKNQNPDGSCKVYKWRPNICRNYPIVDYLDKPVLYDFCGYRAKLRDSGD